MDSFSCSREILQKLNFAGVLSRFSKAYQAGQVMKSSEDKGGGRNQGIFRFEGIVIKIGRKRMPSKESIEKMSLYLVDFSNVFFPLNRLSLGGKLVAVSMEEAPGKRSDQLSPEELKNIPDSHWAQFEKDIRVLAERGVDVDLTKKSNFYYDTKKGFQFIDIDGISQYKISKFYKDPRTGKRYYTRFEKFPVYEYSDIRDIFNQMEKVELGGVAKSRMITDVPMPAPDLVDFIPDQSD